MILVVYSRSEMLDTYLTYLYIIISVVLSSNVYVVLTRIAITMSMKRFNNKCNDLVTWQENSEMTLNATVASISIIIEIYLKLFLIRLT